MHIRLDILEGEIYQLTFDRPDSSANIFDRATIEELDQHLKSLAGDTRMNGLIFMSSKPSIFLAGADISELLSGDLTPSDLREMVRQGQRVFNRIAELRVPTVAAIHGACLGGGFELCLACNIRLATPDKATRIGLPETSLGILPAWGGCTRLPRLIGLPKALDVILNGKRLTARQAFRRGMVDALVPREHLVRVAQARIAAGKPKRASRRLVNNFFSARMTARWLRPRLLKKTGGHYPAVTRALDVVSRGLSKPVADSLALEEDAVAELAGTTACRNLVRIFFMQEHARHLKIVDDKDGSRVSAIESTAVIGAGVMGAGIAQWVSSRGRPVILRDINEEQVGKGMATIAKLYLNGVKRRIFDRTEAERALDRIYPAATDVPLQRTDLVIEAAVERMDIKKEIFARLDDLAGDQAILATNTSALSVSEIAAATRHPARVIGLHFFNPVHRMQLVEIVVGDKTDPLVTERCVRFVQKIGKLPVVSKDRPGFIVNRILMPYLVEAGHLFMRGASPLDVDEAMLRFGMPMGPLRLIDEVGVDVAQHVAAFLAEAFGDRMAVPGVLADMLEAGQLGRKSGAGFYAYSKGRGRPEVNEAVRSGGQNEQGGSGITDLQERMVLVMLNEAARCLEEGIAQGPEDIDFAMIMGTGFAPFRGGPLRHIDSAGIGQVVERMTRLADEVAPRFAPCELLRSYAQERSRFYADE